MTGTEGCEDTALHEAVRYADEDDVRDALRNRCDPNQIGLYQWTPLHEAASSGDISIVKLLLKYKADANKSDWLKGSTAIHYASSSGHVKVLQLLLDSGGKYDVCNNEGKSPLDVASGQCLPLLKKLREEDTKAPAKKMEQTETKEHREIHAVLDKNNCDGEHDITHLEADDISIISGSSASSWPSLRAWETSSNSSTGNNLILGQIQLSFEYNSKNNTLKIRVWQVTDLLFPPTDTSMISTVQVKSYLMPDKKRDSKRKSEALQVYSKADIPSGKGENTFQPRTFSFTKALEYKKVTKDVVTERIAHIEVCVSQKYSRKNYVIATWNSPLSVAVKQLVKSKYPLTPRLSTELPSNMKVYGANQVHLAYENQAYSSSIPNSRTHSVSSLPNPSIERGSTSERSSSDSNLQGVKIEPLKHVPSIEITVPSEDEEEKQLEEDLHQIAIAESKDHSATSIRMGDCSNGSEGAMIELQDLEDVTIDKYCEGNVTTSAIVHIPPRYRENVNEAVNIDSTHVTPKKDAAGQKRAKRFSFNRGTTDAKSKKKNSIKEKDKPSKRNSSSAIVERVPSRPESPAWDTYAEPLTMVPIEFELHELVESLSNDPNAAQLPMETSLEILPKVHRSSEKESVVDIQSHHGSPGEMMGKGKGKGKSSSKSAVKSMVHEV